MFVGFPMHLAFILKVLATKFVSGFAMKTRFFSPKAHNDMHQMINLYTYVFATDLIE